MSETKSTTSGDSRGTVFLSPPQRPVFRPPLTGSQTTVTLTMNNSEASHVIKLGGVTDAEDPAHTYAVTEREKEILTQFARGMSYSAIAEARGNKPATVRNTIFAIQTSWDQTRSRRSSSGPCKTACWIDRTKATSFITPRPRHSPIPLSGVMLVHISPLFIRTLLVMSS